MKRRDWLKTTAGIAFTMTGVRLTATEPLIGYRDGETIDEIIDEIMKEIYMQPIIDMPHGKHLHTKWSGNGPTFEVVNIYA